MIPGSPAAVLVAPRQIELVERPRPGPGPGEVAIRIAATAICHTDLEIYTGRHPDVRYPVVMGHEATGVVAATGPGVTRLGVGQPVLINPIIACGGCESCRRGRDNLCLRAGLLGRELDGALAGYLVLPERYAHALPGNMPLAAATLIETLATVCHAQRRAGIAAGEAVVVLGQGAAGLLHTQVARLAGAAPLIAVSRSAWKLELARRMGAHHVVDAAREDGVAAVRNLTEGRGADVVIDAAGSAEVIPAAVEMLAPGGRLLVYAVSHRPVPGFSTFPIYYKELTLVGSRALTPVDLGPAIDLAASGAVSLQGFVSASYPLSRAVAAFADYEREPHRVLRTVIVPDA